MPATALSLYAGIGGLDLGARAAGLDVCLATDIDADALALLHARDSTATVAGDLSSLLATGRLAKAWEGAAPDVIIGGPPCTAFSHAGFWLERKRNGEDPAAGQLDAFVEALRTFRPKLFVMENVPGLTFSTHERFFTSLLNRVRRAGYSTTWTVLNAADFGVPQNRRRLFVVGSLGGPKIELQLEPKPTVSAGEALRGIKRNPAEDDESPAGQYSHLLPQVPAGGNYQVFTKRHGHPVGLFEYRSRYWSFLLKLDPAQPSPTIPAQRVTWNGPFHWDNRHLRVRELARLQAFPDKQPLDGELSQLRKWIGNAVPPLLAEQVISAALAEAEVGVPSGAA